VLTATDIRTSKTAMHTTRQQGSVVDAESLIGSVVTNVIGGITCAVCTYKLCQTVMCVESVTNGVTCIHTNYLDFFTSATPHFTRCNIRTLPQAAVLTCRRFHHRPFMLCNLCYAHHNPSRPTSATFVEKKV